MVMIVSVYQNDQPWSELLFHSFFTKHVKYIEK